MAKRTTTRALSRRFMSRIIGPALSSAKQNPPLAPAGKASHSATHVPIGSWRMSEIFDYFSGNYTQARQAFRDAASDAGAALAAYHNPATGPGGIALSTETARLGPAAAERLLVIMSGTHGVECFCGSGLQVGLLRSRIAAAMPQGTALLLIHAINPSGFAWVRRVTEDNIDLNRNFIDRSKPAPVNAGYEELREAICPRDWINGREAADAVLAAYGRAHGVMALQAAVSSGQYVDPEGVFYGGLGP